MSESYSDSDSNVSFRALNSDDNTFLDPPANRPMPLWTGGLPRTIYQANQPWVCPTRYLAAKCSSNVKKLHWGSKHKFRYLFKWKHSIAFKLFLQ